MKKIIFILSGLLITIFLQANGSIHVDRYGKGSPVIIIAGLGGTDVWQDCISSLSIKNTCYLISITGLSGEKKHVNPDFNIIENEIADFIFKEKLSDAVLIGHSFGGFIAMKLSLHYPAYFRKLIIADSYPFALSIYNPAITSENGIQQAPILQKQLTDLPEPAYKAFWTQNVQQFTSDTIFQKNILRKIIDSDRNYVAASQGYVLCNDLRTGLEKIKCKVVILCSSYSFRSAGLTPDIIRQRINEQFRNIRDCNIFINDQSRHFLMLDSKDWFIDQLHKNI